MTDEQHPPETPVEDLTGFEDDANVSVSGDGLLNLIVHLAERGLGAGLTIYTSGLIVSGEIIPQKVYLEESRKLAEGTTFTIVYDELLKHAKDNTYRTDKDDDAGDSEIGEPAPDYRYVHLRDARIMSSGAPGIPASGTLMRFLRDEIVGWTLGQLK